MKTLSKIALIAMVFAAALSRAEDHKHPSDPCPKGTHEVQKETKSTVGAEGKVGGSGNIGVAKAEGSAGGRVEKTTTEREKVCRDNKDSNVKESTKSGSDKPDKTDKSKSK